MLIHLNKFNIRVVSNMLKIIDLSGINFSQPLFNAKVTTDYCQEWHFLGSDGARDYYTLQGQVERLLSIVHSDKAFTEGDYTSPYFEGAIRDNPLRYWCNDARGLIGYKTLIGLLVHHGYVECDEIQLVGVN